MANTTSGTTVFEKGFSISDIVEEAYERIGIQGVSGYQQVVLTQQLILDHLQTTMVSSTK